MRCNDRDEHRRRSFADHPAACAARRFGAAGSSASPAMRCPSTTAPEILAEHTHTRTAAGLFDVSHMGQAFLVGPDHDTTARALETLVPADLVELRPGQMRYTQLLAPSGGIVDDLMVIRSADPNEDGVLMLDRQCGAAKSMTTRSFATACQLRFSCYAQTIAPCWPCRGLGPARCLADIAPRLRRWRS